MKKPDLATADGSFVRLDARAFGAIPSESIDYAVTEPSRREAGDPLARGAARRRLERPERLGRGLARGRARRGWQRHARRRARAQLAQYDCPRHSRLVGVVGLDDVAVVETADAVLVAHRSYSPAVKDFVGKLTKASRSAASTHRRVHRPWGWYKSVDQGPRFLVKRILVKPGARLSLQMHYHRAEHWIGVSGMAEATHGETVTILSENQSTYIPIRQRHRLGNPGKVALEIIERQSGSYRGDDDIFPFEDNYGRG